ncbi:hypothetical protein [Streptacidiphilus jiangxiensis]|uniref:hypothetical protein n=1 Tax=Streptacidiphilus jiangxiensis TaxID=235985 RepID=UPI001160AE31|nr:hypothetical protein [Streptacidiphilus jiangxiensis]
MPEPDEPAEPDEEELLLVGLEPGLCSVPLELGLEVEGEGEVLLGLGVVVPPLVLAPAGRKAMIAREPATPATATPAVTARVRAMPPLGPPAISCLPFRLRCVPDTEPPGRP